jgi:hypothetical protein
MTEKSRYKIFGITFLRSSFESLARKGHDKGNVENLVNSKTLWKTVCYGALEFNPRPNFKSYRD